MRSIDGVFDATRVGTRFAIGNKPILVYDHVGIRDMWAAHLKWLDDNIKSVRAIKVSEVGWMLAGFEG